MTGCPDDARLERLLRGDAPRVRGWLWRRHLRGCPGCRARYAELDADRRLVADLRAALHRPPPDREK
jgi:anti-sigma factor RsiW